MASAEAVTETVTTTVGVTLTMSIDEARLLSALLYSKVVGGGEHRETLDSLNYSLQKVTGKWVLRGNDTKADVGNVSVMAEWRPRAF